MVLRGLDGKDCAELHGFWNEARSAMSIHCGWHPLCRLNRSLVAGRHNKNQGRPLGFMQAWEEAGGDVATQAEHIRLSYAPHRNRFTFEVRRAARGRVKAEHSLDSLRAKERLVRVEDGELSEPEGLC